MKRSFLAALVVFCAVSFAFSQQLDEKKRGFFGRVIDEAGNPVVGVTVVLSKKADLSDGLELKTTDRGFTFPRMPEDVGEFFVGIKSDEYFIRKFMLRSRRGTGEIAQNISGELGPASQDKMPALYYRAGNAIAEFVLVKKADWAARNPAAPAKPAEASLDDQVAEMVALGDYKGAADKLAAAVEQNPEDTEHRWQRALLLEKGGESAEAIKEARKVLAKEPNRTGVRPRLARWLSDIGQDAEVVPLLEKERELDPANGQVYKQLAAAYRDAGRKDDEAATVAKWHEAAPDDVEAILALAGIKAAAGDFAAAEKLYRDVAQKDPANAPRSFYNVGVSIFNQKGDMNAAASALEQAVQLKPDYAKAYEMLGYVRLNQGKVPEAKAAFSKFLELAPNDPNAADIKKTVGALK